MICQPYIRYLVNPTTTWLWRASCSYSILPYQVWPSDLVWPWQRVCPTAVRTGGVRTAWIFIMTSPVYWLQCGGHTQVRLSGLSKLAREEGGSVLIAHMRDIQESAGSRQLDKWRCSYRCSLVKQIPLCIVIVACHCLVDLLLEKAWYQRFNSEIFGQSKMYSGPFLRWNVMCIMNICTFRSWLI